MAKAFSPSDLIWKRETKRFVAEIVNSVLSGTVCVDQNLVRVDVAVHPELKDPLKQELKNLGFESVVIGEDHLVVRGNPYRSGYLDSLVDIYVDKIIEAFPFALVGAGKATVNVPVPPVIYTPLRLKLQAANWTDVRYEGDAVNGYNTVLVV